MVKSTTEVGKAIVEEEKTENQKSEISNGRWSDKGQGTPSSALGSRSSNGWIETLHSNRNLSPATGKSYEPLTPKHFSFNAPSGACPVCHGLGQKMVFDEELVVPDPEKSLEQGAILPWRRGGKRMVAYYKSLLRGITSHYHQNVATLYKN